MNAAQKKAVSNGLKKKIIPPAKVATMPQHPWRPRAATKEEKRVRALRETHSRRDRGAAICARAGCVKRALAGSPLCPMHHDLGRVTMADAGLTHDDNLNVYGA